MESTTPTPETPTADPFNVVVRLALLEYGVLDIKNRLRGEDGTSMRGRLSVVLQLITAGAGVAVAVMLFRKGAN